MRAFTALLLAAALAPAARAGRSLQQPMATAPLQPEPLPAAAREQPITFEAPMGLAPLTELLAGFAPAPEAEVERGRTLLEIVRRRAARDLGSVNLLIEAVPGATELLSSREVPITLFAPTDEARRAASLPPDCRLIRRRAELERECKHLTATALPAPPRPAPQAFARRLSQLGFTQLSQLLEQPELARAVSAAPRPGRLSPGARARLLNPSRSPRRPPPADPRHVARRSSSSTSSPAPLPPPRCARTSRSRPRFQARSWRSTRRAGGSRSTAHLAAGARA
jgi:hypothetical protein